MLATFLTSAARPDQFPAETLPEIAFLGRSNVGKSSVVNCLSGQDRLAFTSATPGCTQMINFYRIDDQFHFVDLPGYGFARVPKEVKSHWRRLIEEYLVDRKSLLLCFLILDARRGWMEQDLELKEWLEFHNRRYMVIATKTDKLKTQKEQRLGVDSVRSHSPDKELLPFSAAKCRGVREIWQAIWKTKNQQQ